MLRRAFLAVAVLGGGAFGYQNRDQLDEFDLPEAGSQSLDGDLDRMEWNGDETVLTVWFEEQHESDFLALVHEYDEETVIWHADAPRFAGPLKIPMLKAVACDDTEYPTRTFELVAGIGTLAFGLVEENTARQTFDVKQGWLDRAAGLELERGECMRPYF